MHRWNRKLGQVADCLQDWLVQRSPAPGAHPLPQADWDRLEKSARQISLAQARGWKRAASRLSQKLARDLGQYGRQCHELSQLVAQQLREQHVAGRSEILKDLLALADEFSEVRYDFGSHQLCVRTDPIELEGVELGPFEIRLDWQQKYSAVSYDVVALEPNPPSFNSAVTHPHVQNDQLCEGEGRTAIRAALRQGRFFDFFLLVARVLGTYSPDSAYASLADWYGTACSDCGRTTGEDDGCQCERCEETVCDACCSSCQACGRSQCSECISICEGCQERHCASCLESCPACQVDFCTSCLEEGLCHDCQKEQNTDQEKDQEDGAAAQRPVEPLLACSAAAVQPDGLGQAALSARPGTD